MENASIGFRHAPVTKFVLLTTSGLSVALQNSDLRVSSSALRFFEPFLFRQLGELAFGTYLLYTFRVFERQRGSERSVRKT